MNKWFLILCLMPSVAYSQKGMLKQTGAAEKWWAITHPFQVKKAYKISKKVLQELDSLKATGYFSGNTLSGSKADAVRHAYWMSSLSAAMGKRKALKLGVAHEKKNKKDFKKGELEEAFLPDLASVVMDLHNNEVGAKLYSIEGESNLNTVLKALKDGSLLYMKQNAEGEFLNKNGNVIPLKEWSGKWENERTLVPTNL